MTSYYEKSDQQWSQRYRSTNSSRASKNYFVDEADKFRSAASSRSTTNGDYFPIPVGTRRAPSIFNNNDTPIRESKKFDIYQISPVPTYERTTNGTTLNRPGSPGPVAGAGEITNTEHGFTIDLDVFRFKPEEIKVVLTDDLLSISGERMENAGDGQTLRRSFSRKYSIPEDIYLDSIRCHLADNGILVVNGSRRGWRETNISTHFPRKSSAKSVISTV